MLIGSPSPGPEAEVETAPGASPLAGRKILIVIENLPAPFDRRVWQEARALTEAGAQVVVICPTGKGFTERYQHLEGIHIYRHPLPLEGKGALGYLAEYGAALLYETALAWRIFFKHGFDTVHGCNPPDLIFLVALQFKLFGVRYIFDHHDINPEFYEAKFAKRGPFWRLLHFFEWLTFKTAKVVISTNESYREIALRRGGKRQESVFVVRSGPDLTRLRPTSPNPALKNGRAYLAAYVGVISEPEGIDFLLESVRFIVRERGRQDIQFRLVGGGPSVDKMRQLCAEMGLDEYVTFTGRVSDEELFETLATADICVNPDKVNAMADKSTMNKILEYMAFGKPIVQFDVVEGRYSAQEASLYARANDPLDFAEKILFLMDNPDERARMGRLGRERLQSALSWSHQTPKLIAAYRAAAS